MKVVSADIYDVNMRPHNVSLNPVILRLTTRICHSKTVVLRRPLPQPEGKCHFEIDIPGRVMVPANARPAHRRLRKKLAEIEAWNETSDLHPVFDGDGSML